MSLTDEEIEKLAARNAYFTLPDTLAAAGHLAETFFDHVTEILEIEQYNGLCLDDNMAHSNDIECYNFTLTQVFDHVRAPDPENEQYARQGYDLIKDTDFNPIFLTLNRLVRHCPPDYFNIEQVNNILEATPYSIFPNRQTPACTTPKLQIP